MPKTSQGITQKIEKELGKIGWQKTQITLTWRGKFLLFTLRHRKWMWFVMKHLEINWKEKTWKFKFKW